MLKVSFSNLKSYVESSDSEVEGEEGEEADQADVPSPEDTVINEKE